MVILQRVGSASNLLSGLFTGMHEPEASHFELLSAFVDPPLLGAAYEHAARAGYLGHEFGDSNLILSRSSSARAAPAIAPAPAH